VSVNTGNTFLFLINVKSSFQQNEAALKSVLNCKPESKSTK